MTEQAASQTKNLRKKLQKREQRVLERLKEAQLSQAKALERYHRSEERLQKRMARLGLIEGQLTLVRQQINDLHVNSDMPSVEIEIPAWAQYTPPSSTGEDTSSNAIESTGFVREARAAAKATEENTRTAAARAVALNETSNSNLETAEAEVAEGMAYAAIDRSDPLLAEAHEVVANESDIAREISHIQTQEME